MTENFTFEEQRTKYTAYVGPSGMVGFLIKKVGVPNEKIANFILLTFAIIIFIISGFVLTSALRV